jgi:integrase
MDMKGQMKNSEDSQDRNVTGMSTRYIPVSRAAKTHQDYWKTRIKRCTFTGRDGEKYSPPEYYVRMFHLGRETWFSLDTANQSAATIKARDIYLSLIASGWEATLARFKPSPISKADVCSVGEFLADVGARSHLKPMTVRRYAVKLRKMVADIAKVEAGVKGRAKRAKYDYMKGGRNAWLAKVDSQPLNLLTPDAVNAWRNHYVAKAGSDPMARKSAERSAASYLRCARSLFTREVTAMLHVKLPANPFAGVKLKDPGPQRYHSEINPEWLLACAGDELRLDQPQQYLALFLCLWAGLRRKEADLLTWAQIDFQDGLIHIRRTVYFEPKTEESQRDIDLAPEAIDVLRSFKKGSTSEFVLDGAQPNPAATYDYYRCDCIWRDLNAWLRGKGVRQQKAIHSLRKESGSLIASVHGIEAARQHLGHRDIRTTSSHYVDKKKRVEVKLPLGGMTGKFTVVQ